MEVSKVAGKLDPNGFKNGNSSSQLDGSLYEEYEDDEYEDEVEPEVITVKVTVRHLAGVTANHHVFCQ